jgi:hypothetical protein
MGERWQIERLQIRQNKKQVHHGTVRSSIESSNSNDGFWQLEHESHDELTAESRSGAVASR